MGTPATLAFPYAYRGPESAAVLNAEDDALIIASAVMGAVLEQVKRVAGSKVAVLITGETGTGKELVARYLHLASPRAPGPFVRVNCAALSEGLVESELFGHERGAFTGAEESRRGRFEAAQGGTLLLDEVSETSVRLQAKLLRVLEEGEFQRVGDNQTLASDARIVATTNRDLSQAVARGDFRRDLYYRLNAVEFNLPPLRARRDDIPVLAAHFFEQSCRETATPLRGFARRTIELLTAYDWPGNVRQLRNVVQRACLLAAGPDIEPHDLPPLPTPPAAGAAPGGTLAEIERQVILCTLRELDGSKTATARRLGITPRTLLNKLKKYRAEEAA